MEGINLVWAATELASFNTVFPSYRVWQRSPSVTMNDDNKAHREAWRTGVLISPGQDVHPGRSTQRFAQPGGDLGEEGTGSPQFCCSHLPSKAWRESRVMKLTWFKQAIWVDRNNKVLGEPLELLGQSSPEALDASVFFRSLSCPL